MEDKALKLMAQLGLLAVCVWALAAAMGRRSDPAGGDKRTWQERQGRGVWAPSMVSAPMAQGAEYVPAAVGPLTRY